jgi:hypothetical protein
MKILITENQLDKIIKSQMIDEEISSGSIVAYHRTVLSPYNIKLLNNGFIPGDSNKYGKGLYSTYEYEDQLNPSMIKYGSIIVKLSVMNLNKIVVLDKSEQVKLFGKEISLENQLKKILKGKYNKFLNNGNNKRLFDSIYDYDRNLPDDMLTGFVASQLFSVSRFTLAVDGLVFTEKNDGKVIVLYNTDIANPLQYIEPYRDNVWINLKDKESFKIGRDSKDS